jgi:hypothetical protein
MTRTRTAGLSTKTGSAGALKAAARARRQAAAALLHSALRSLGQEPLWRDANDPELQALRASLESARDELARQIPSREQARLDAEWERTQALHQLGRKLDARVEP